MFGKKTKMEESPIIAKVHTIPMEFYGGANPAVKFKKVEKEVTVDAANHVLTRAEKSMLHQTTAAGAGKRWHPANFFASQKFLFWSIGGLFILFVASAGFYYFWQWRSTQPIVLPPAPAVTYQPPAETPAVVTEPVVIPTTTITTPLVSLAEDFLDFPSLLLGDSADLDKDGLADKSEEEVFQTDAGASDTDSDQYADAIEIYNLYNPAGFTPVRIIDSGLVKDYSNPNFGYQIYYPAQWALGVVDAGARDVLFSTLTGENIEMRVFDLEGGQEFSGWFTKWAAREKFSDLAPFESAFKEKGVKRSDGLVYYFSDRTHVYVMLYHTTDSNVINFRSAITMMARSFRLQGNTVALPIPVNIESNSLGELPAAPIGMETADVITVTNTEDAL